MTKIVINKYSYYYFQKLMIQSYFCDVNKIVTKFLQIVTILCNYYYYYYYYFLFFIFPLNFSFFPKISHTTSKIFSKSKTSTPLCP